jgi:UDP:flavonoid glycosyltransferase YjiC (YdhE family)
MFDVQTKHRTRAWRNLLDIVQPQLILFDHSPTALLAARGTPAKVALIGSGFFCPPDEHPLPNLRPWMKLEAQKLLEDETRVLNRMNDLLQMLKQPPLTHISQLYSQADDLFLTTFKELDHYPQRQNGRYWGAWTKVVGKIPQWPGGSGKRIYAYLKPFTHLPQVLDLLRRLNHRTLIYSDGIDPQLQRQFSTDKLRFENQPLDLNRIGAECDLAILNGNHGTTIAMLMAGKPTFQLPITLEQVLFARAVRRLGAGLDANTEKPQQICERLPMMLMTDQYATAAQRFAQKYAQFDPLVQRDKMLARVEELISR